MTATLIALDEIRSTARILDVGCGTGTEALLLAEWGCQSVDGVDADPDAIRIARSRAKRRKLHEKATFHVLDAAALRDQFKPRSFDVVLHTLVANNLEEKEVEPHFRAVRAVIKPKGLLVVQERVHRKFDNRPPDELPPYEGLEKHFDLTVGVSTQIPEHRARRRDPDYARIVLWLGRPRK